MNNFSDFKPFRFYNRDPAENRHCYLMATGTDLTIDRHEAFMSLCALRNFYICRPDALYYHTVCDLDFKDTFNDMLEEYGLPPVKLKGIPDDFITTKDFADSKVISRGEETFTPQKARYLAAKHAFEEIKIIQKYLYEIDKKYGTCYVDINLPVADVTKSPKGYSEISDMLDRYLHILFVDEIIHGDDHTTNV